MPEAPQSKFVIEPFDKKKHDRTALSCEHEALVAYLKKQASPDVARYVAAVFVLTRDGRTIAGYYALSQYAVDHGNLPEAVLRRLGLPKYQQFPATLLGRLARSLDFKGQGVGELLIMSALKRSLDHSKSIASIAVVADAKDERAVRFYTGYGFIGLPDHPNRVFLPMRTIEQMFGSKF